VKQPSEQTLVALTVLRGNPHFLVVMKWIAESLRDQDEHNRAETDDVLLRQGQGKALELADFTKTVGDASGLIERIRSAPERRAQDESQV